jgi:hypothetical protein
MDEIENLKRNVPDESEWLQHSVNRLEGQVSTITQAIGSAIQTKDNSLLSNNYFSTEGNMNYTPEQIKEMERKSALADQLQADKDEAERKLAVAQFASELDKSEYAGKVTPATKPIAVRIFEKIYTQPSYKFSTADGKEQETTPVEDFKTLLKGLKDEVTFGEESKNNGTDQQRAGTESPEELGAKIAAGK